jgi:peptide deformylase
MSRLTLVKEPTPSLRVRSTEVAASDIGSERIKTLIKDMKETMYHEKGVGIAAPQVGVNERVIIVEMEDGPTGFINPKISSPSFATTAPEEGCLSVPGVFGLVKRNKRIKLEAFSEDGEPINMEVTGFPAIIFQHEVDHLDGTLFIDKAYEITSNK